VLYTVGAVGSTSAVDAGERSLADLRSACSR